MFKNNNVDKLAIAYYEFYELGNLKYWRPEIEEIKSLIYNELKKNNLSYYELLHKNHKIEIHIIKCNPIVLIEMI